MNYLTEALLAPPRLALRAPTDHRTLVPYTDAEPLHVPPALLGAEDLDRITESLLYLYRPGQHEPEALLRVAYVTVAEALAEWRTYLAHLGRRERPAQTPRFTLDDIDGLREGTRPWVARRLALPERPTRDARGTHGLSPNARHLLTLRTNAAVMEASAYDGVAASLAVLVPEAALTSDMAWAYARRAARAAAADVVGDAHDLDPYVVSASFRAAQTAHRHLVLAVWDADTEEEYRRRAATADAFWRKEMGPAMSALDATRRLDDEAERVGLGFTWYALVDQIDRGILPWTPRDGRGPGLGVLYGELEAAHDYLGTAAERELARPLPDPATVAAHLRTLAPLAARLPGLPVADVLHALMPPDRPTQDRPDVPHTLLSAVRPPRLLM